MAGSILKRESNTFLSLLGFQNTGISSVEKLIDLKDLERVKIERVPVKQESLPQRPTIEKPQPYLASNRLV